MPRHPPQRRHAVRDREQRRLRPHQGTVLGIGRPGIDEQERRSQHDGGDRRRAAGADARRHVRGAQLLRRQAPARADHQGGDHASRLRLRRRDLAVRDVQRSRGLDQELRAHARAQGRRGAGRLRAAPRRDHHGLRGRLTPERDVARRQLGEAPQAR